MSPAWPRRLALALGLCFAGAGLAQADTYAARVVRVFDGDTLWVQPADGGRWRKLRLDGLDAPEICQDGGVRARDALAARSLGRSVQVDVRARDGYGRGLARLTLDGEDLNRWLVAEGLAWASRWHGRAAYGTEEDRARQRRLGLFGADDPLPPRDFRRRHGPCERQPTGLSAVP